MPAQKIEINAIAAICPWTRSIGHHDGRLPWDRIPKDFGHFKRTTSATIKGQRGYPLIMGRKTFETFKRGPLPNRPHIVLSREPDYYPPSNTDEKGRPMVVKAMGIEEAIGIAIQFENFVDVNRKEPKVFVIGGGEIYELFMDLIEKIVITKIEPKDRHENIEAPVKFPPYTRWGFKKVIESFKIEDDKYDCVVEVITRAV